MVFTVNMGITCRRAKGEASARWGGASHRIVDLGSHFAAHPRFPQCICGDLIPIFYCFISGSAPILFEMV